MKPAPPAISITVETYTPGQWHYTVRLYGRAAGDDDGEPCPTFALAVKAALAEAQAAMAERSADDE
jgi:hypothetical protein